MNQYALYLIPDLKEDSPPYVAIYYKRDNSEWFTESLYRKRLRFNFKDGVIKIDHQTFGIGLKFLK